MTLFRKLDPDAKAPEYMTKLSAGADISSLERVQIAPGETKLVRTGIAIALPACTVGLLFPRSGLSLRTPLRQPNSVGVIDADYRGEVHGMFQNTGDETVVIEKGMRIAQLVIVPVEYESFVEVDDLGETKRGEGGFGSTGMR